MLLAETNSNSLHVQAAKLYLDSDFFLSCLTALAYFTYRVTLPLLNCVEICSQEQLLPILTSLVTDLAQCNMTTLEEYKVEWRNISLPEPNDVVKLLLKRMCVDASKVVQLQCGREYGIQQEEDAAQRGTQLFKLSSEELRDLPTENCMTHICRK